MSARLLVVVAHVMVLMSISLPAAADEPVADHAEEVALEMPVIEVIGKPERQKKLPGSAQILDRETLELSRVMTTSEALRKAAGINVRDEEGFGLRPNIGIRGLNPTRSTKVLLLEDGIPLAYAPYGDNASYYHPPIDRFDRIEILKGAGQNIYGPQTVGGVINYITPAPPADFGGGVMLTGGNRGYGNAHGYIGGRGMLFDYVRKQGDLARANTHTELDDVNYKAVLSLGADHALTARANWYNEDSQVTYSGLTDAEFANFGPEYNPFEYDEFKAHREGVSFTHQLALGANRTVTTNVYGSRYNRDWWRQASSTGDGQCGAAFTNDRLAGNAVDPDACASNLGNLREYYSYGVEPRLTFAHGLFGLANELEAGVRAHFEEQDRLQFRGTGGLSRAGGLTESNERLNQAFSAFAQNRFGIGRVALTPSLRVEHVRYERNNRCPNANFNTPFANASLCSAPTSGEAEITEVIPGFGVTVAASDTTTLFAGVHRGFAPPGTADLINGTSGATVDLESEESWNYELGARARPSLGLKVEATLFVNDFSRQIAVGSIAAGGVPLATGETRYEGVELLARGDLGRLVDSSHNPFVEVAYTWLPTADQETPFRQVVAGTPVPGSSAGKRLPYAPEQLLTTAVGYDHPLGVDVRLEAVFVDEQFADFANTAVPAANGNGQVGQLGAYTVFNAALNYRVASTGFGVFATAKNLFDEVYVADRTRGILPGAPRLVQAGVHYRF